MLGSGNHGGRHAAEQDSFLQQLQHTIRLYHKRWLKFYRGLKFRLPHLALFPFTTVYSELLLRFFSGTAVFAHFLYPLLFGLAAGLLLACATSPFPKRVNWVISLVFLWLTGIGFSAAALIRNAFGLYMSISGIRGGTHNVVAGYFGWVIVTIVRSLPIILLFLLPAILYTAMGKRRMPAGRYPPVFCAGLLAVSLVLTGVCALCASHGAYQDIYTGRQDFNASTVNFGLITALRLDLTRGSSDEFIVEASEGPAESAETEEQEAEAVPVTYGLNEMDLDLESLMRSSDETVASVSTYVNSLTASSQNEYTGLFKGKNLILICAEAFSDAVINEDLTPTLYRLSHNGFYFSDYYQPAWGGSTSSGEYSFLFGLVPTYMTDAVLKTQNNNNYFTLGNQLQRKGYYSLAFHNGTYDFYSRNLTHTNLGYAEYIADGSGMERVNEGSYNTDTEMFEVTVSDYIDKQPFSIYYMTFSGHSIYDSESPLVDKYYDQVYEEYGDTYQPRTLYYFCFQQELETALTYLVDQLEAAGIADDTVICLTADHYPYGLMKSQTYCNDEDYVADLYGGSDSLPWEEDHNSLIIWSGCMENENKDMACEISSPTYSLDIVPTLSNLFGLEYDSRLLVGRDVFSDAEPLVVWNGYSWLTEQGKYDASTGTYYPNEGYEENEDYVERIKTRVSNIISYSGSVTDCDYYRVLFGADTVTDNSNYKG